MKISTLIFSGKVFFTDREGIVASLFNTADTSMELFDDMKITEIVSKISNSATYQSMYEMLLTSYYNQVKNYYSKDLPKHIDTFDKFKSEVTYQDTFVETETIDEDDLLSEIHLHCDNPQFMCPLYTDARVYLVKSKLTNKF